MTQTSRSRKPSLEWATGLSEQDKEMFLTNLEAAPLFAQQLRKLVLARLDGLEKKECDESVYRDAGYPTWQAFINGRRAEALYFLSLTSFLET